MTYTEAQIRAVRLQIPDSEPVFGDASDKYMFEDADIAIFLDQGAGNAMYAAGLAMIAVGNSEALIGKVMRNYETETDASKLQKEWRTSGIELIKIAKALVDDDDAGFFIVAYPEWDAGRHPEGESHGSYRMPTPFQW